MKKSLLILTLLGLTLAACSYAIPQPDAQPLATSSALKWISIKMTQSGGIMGLSHIIEIGSDGHAMVADERAAKTGSFGLSEEERSQLDALITASLKLTRPQLELNCADCFVYALEISFPAKSGTVQLSDLQLAESGYEPLVTFLRMLMDDALR